MTEQLSQKTLVFDLLTKIPNGRVTTYGHVGICTGVNPRVVGWILSGMTDDESEKYPWQRVVAKGGVISSLKLGIRGEAQIQLLSHEGVVCHDGVVVNYQSVYWECSDDSCLF
jgi:methylated-DNA-protein-cysteine methyltransferase related protein